MQKHNLISRGGILASHVGFLRTFSKVMGRQNLIYSLGTLRTSIQEWTNYILWKTTFKNLLSLIYAAATTAIINNK